MGEHGGTHQLVMVRGDEVLFSIRLGEGDAALIGRSPAAQVVLRDPEVSWMHAMVWVERGWLWVRDISSTNGTLINSRRLKEATLVERESQLQVGTTLLTLQPGRSSRTVQQLRLWVEDLSSGLRFMLTDELRPLPGGLSQIRRSPEGRAMLYTPAAPEGRAINIGDTFSVEGRAYRVLDELLADPEPTDYTREPGLPYALSFPADTPPVFTEITTGTRHVLSSARRGEILRFLAERLHHDRQQKASTAQQGWCDDDELGRHLWGEDWSEGSNRLNVILHRIRRELESAGLDGGCLEKRRGGLRLWVQRIQLSPAPPIAAPV